LIVGVGGAAGARQCGFGELPGFAAAGRRARIEPRGKYAEEDAGDIRVDERRPALVGE